MKIKMICTMFLITLISSYTYGYIYDIVLDKNLIIKSISKKTSNSTIFYNDYNSFFDTIIFSQGDILQYKSTENKLKFSCTRTAREYKSMPIYSSPPATSSITIPIQESSSTTSAQLFFSSLNEIQFTVLGIQTEKNKIIIQDIGSINITQHSSVYNVEIIKNENNKLTNTIQTYNRFYFGMQVGVFRSLLGEPNRIRKYPITATEFIARQVNDYPIKAIAFGTWYPFGFEPEHWDLSSLWYKRIQVNIGTEISEKAFKTFFIGGGYCLNYLSLNIMFKFYENEALTYYARHSIVSSTFGDNYTRTRWKWSVGWCMSVPIEFWMGSLINK